MSTVPRLSVTPLAMLRRARTATLALAAAGTLLVPVSVVAQAPLAPVRVQVPAVTRDARNNARADTLESWADRFYNTPRQWARAAQLYERAAQLRGDNPRAVTSWRLAAWLYSAARDPGKARVMMEHAAESAAAGGDVERAADSYIDAALIALTSRRVDRVPGLLHRTRVVLGSPLLSAERRAAILRRIGEEPRLAEAWNAGEARQGF